jgi:hypothetical protein
VYVGGRFSEADADERTNLAAFDAGSGDVTPWSPRASNVNALAVQGATVFVGGTFGSVGDQERHFLGAIDATSGTTTSWRADTNAPVDALAVQGATLYVGGQMSSVGVQPRSGLAAVDAGTGAPTAWNPSVSGQVATIAASGSAVYLGGQFDSIDGQPHRSLAAVDAGSGAVLPWSADTDSGGVVGAMAISGSTLYVGGSFTAVGAQPRVGAAALALDSGTPTAWNPDAGGSVTALAVSNSAVYVGGTFGSIDGLTRNLVAAVDPTTGAPTAWNPQLVGHDVAALTLSGSTLYIGGAFASVGGQRRIDVAAIDTGTAQPTSWNPGVGPPNLTGDDWDSYVVDALAVTGSTVYLGGSFPIVAGQPRTDLAAVDSATGTATPWDPEPNRDVLTLTTSGSTVYAGGLFTSMSLAPQSGFAVFSDPPRAPGAPVNTAVPSIVGTPAVGQVLSCAHGGWLGATPIAYAYSWLRDGTAIASGRSYTPTAADAGHALSCTVTATNPVGSAPATSESVAIPPGSGPVPDTTPPTISISTPTDGQHFTAGDMVASVFSCDDPGGSGVASCSGPATLYTGTAGDQAFTVTATDNAGNTNSKTVTYHVDPYVSIPFLLPPPTPPVSTPPVTTPKPPPACTAPCGKTPPAPPPTLGKLSTLRPDSKHRVPVVVRCPTGRARCTGTIRISRGQTLGSASYSVASGHSQTVRVPLKASRIRAYAGKTVAVSVALLDAGGHRLRSAATRLVVPNARQ